MPAAKRSTRPLATVPTLVAGPATASAGSASVPATRVLRQFRLVFNTVKTHFQQVEKQAGLGGAQVWALSVIQARPGIGVTGLAAAMDVHQTSLLGQHALSYTALSFLAAMIQRRLLWFKVPSQAVQVLPLFAVAHAVELIIRMLGGGIFPGWILLMAPLLEALLWPLASVLLLVPQRRAPDPDENRPL